MAVNDNPLQGQMLLQGAIYLRPHPSLTVNCEYRKKGNYDGDADDCKDLGQLWIAKQADGGVDGGHKEDVQPSQQQNRSSECAFGDGYVGQTFD